MEQDLGGTLEKLEASSPEPSLMAKHCDAGAVLRDIGPANLKQTQPFESNVKRFGGNWSRNQLETITYLYKNAKQLFFDARHLMQITDGKKNHFVSRVNAL